MHLYINHYIHKKTPNVALLNIGSEELKGNETIKETYKILNEKKSEDFNFFRVYRGQWINEW